MRKTLVVTAACMALAASAFAQNLGTTDITDQFSTGARGNETGTGGGFGASLSTGAENQAYAGADATGTPITYINAYAGASAGDAGNGESPVVAVTAVGNADRNQLTQTIPANDRPGATSASDVVNVGDDGGQNTLLFGDDTSDNYYVEVDAYCYDRSAFAGSEWVMVGFRVGRNTATQVELTAGAFSIDRDAGYAIVFDTRTLTVSANEFANGNTGLAAGGTGTVHGSQALAAGWHTFRIEGDGTTVNFLVDGVQFATTAAGATLTGRGAVGIRETGVTATDEIGGAFDNLRAGPFTLADVNAWDMY